ncbi:MAG: GerMN domain-containing protein [Patescibacteria group bacterium]|jgi:putative hemolysin
MKKNLFLISILILTLLLTGCLKLIQSSKQEGQTNTNVGLANPASVKCEQDSGTLNIIEDAGGLVGNQIGICTFSDGSKCEEWAYFRNECQVGNKIIVYSPNKNQEFTFPLTITGEARGNWFFEASFPVKLLDANNQVIAQTIASAKSDWMTTDFVPFEAEIVGSILSQSGQIPVTLVLQRDNPSGLPQNDEQITIPLILSQPETDNINVYFGNSQFDPEVMDCTKVFAIQRTIVKTEAIGRAALEELLKGPTETEKNDGYFTSINPGVKIQSLNIENGTAKVDFNAQLEYAVGGSCRVAAISSQIRQTLKQFPTVNNVIISIDGRTEDILQP